MFFFVLKYLKGENIFTAASEFVAHSDVCMMCLAYQIMKMCQEIKTRKSFLKRGEKRLIHILRGNCDCGAATVRSITDKQELFTVFCCV